MLCTVHGGAGLGNNNTFPEKISNIKYNRQHKNNPQNFKKFIHIARMYQVCPNVIVLHNIILRTVRCYRI